MKYITPVLTALIFFTIINYTGLPLAADRPPTVVSTLKASDIITKGPYTDVRSFMDGASGRPTLAAWKASPTTVDVTTAIKAAVAATPAGGTVYIPNGTYMIKATGAGTNGAGGGIIVTKSLKIVLDTGTVLQAITGNQANSQIISVENVDGFELSGGKLIGDRDARTSTYAANSNYLLTITKSNNVYVHDTTLTAAQSDCLRIDNQIPIQYNHRYERVIFDRGRRWCASAAAMTNLSFSNCTFSNAVTELPYGGGLDLEDEWAAAGGLASFNNVTVENCLFTGNAAPTANFQFAPFTGKNLKIIKNTFESSPVGININNKFYPAETFANIGTVTDLNISDNTFNSNNLAIQIYTHLDTAVIKNNRISESASSIVLGGQRGSTVHTVSNVKIEGNTIINSAAGTKTGLLSSVGIINSLLFTGNSLTNVKTPLNLPTTSYNTTVSNNYFSWVTDGVFIQGTRTLFTGNSIIDSGSNVGGIYMLATDATVTGNRVHNATWCIFMATNTSSRCYIANNYLSNCSTYHIYAQAQGTRYGSIFLNNYRITTDTIIGGINIDPVHRYVDVYDIAYPQASRGRSATVPTAGTYVVGEWVSSTAPATTGYLGWITTVSGTFDTVSTTCTADGTAVVVVASATGLKTGQYVNIAGAFNRILGISGTSITMTVAVTTGSGLTFVNSPPILKTFGALTP